MIYLNLIIYKVIKNLHLFLLLLFLNKEMDCIKNEKETETPYNCIVCWFFTKFLTSITNRLTTSRLIIRLWQTKYALSVCCYCVISKSNFTTLQNSSLKWLMQYFNDPWSSRNGREMSFTYQPPGGAVFTRLVTACVIHHNFAFNCGSLALEWYASFCKTL